MANTDRHHDRQEQIALLLRRYADGQQVCDLELHKAELLSVDFEGLHGENLCLTEADMSDVVLNRAQLMSCDLRHARLTRADLSQATLRGCDLSNIRADDARCESACFENSILQGADFTRAHLVGARLSASSWARAYLPRVVLDGAEGDAVTFRGADLVDASLVGVCLPAADFRGADLTGADLSDGDFSGADFRGAILDEVRWLGARYSNALFDSNRPDEEMTRPPAASVAAPEQDDFATSRMKRPYAGSDAVSVVMGQLISLISASDLKTQAAAGQQAQVPQVQVPQDQAPQVQVPQGEQTTHQKRIVDMIMKLDTEPKSGAQAKTPRYPAGATLSSTLEKLFPDITEPDEAALETLVSTMANVLEKKKRERGSNGDNNPET